MIKTAEFYGVFSLKDVARELGVTYNTLDSRARIGTFPEGTMQIGKRRFYTPDQLVAIKAMREGGWKIDEVNVR